MKFFLLFFLLYSCSKPGTNDLKNLKQPLIPLQVSNLSVDILDEGSFASESEIDFLQLQEGQSETKIIKIKNSSNLSKSVILSSLNNFVITNECSQSLAPRGSCFVKISFSGSPSRTAMGQISESFQINDETIDIVAQSVAIPELVADSSELVINPSSINLGSFSRNEIKKYISIKNNGMGPKKLEISHQLDPDFSISHNCPSELVSRTNCSILLTYSSSNSNLLSSNNKIIINNEEYPVQLSKDGRPSSNELITFSQSINFGSLNSGSRSSTIVIKNTDLFEEPLELNASQLDKYSYQSNCPSVLKSRKKCYIKFNISVNNDNFVKENFNLESKPISLITNSENEFRILTPMAKLADESIDPTAQPGYTKLNQVYLDFNGTEGADEMKISNDNTCTSGTWALYNSKPQVSLTLNSLNQYFVKFRSGPNETDCISATSLIHDNMNPSVNFLSPVSSASIAGSSLTVSGSCSEINPANISLAVSLNSVTQNVNCSSGLWTSDFNIASLPNGTHEILVSSVDFAGNTNSVARSFNKITCSIFQDTIGNNCIDRIPTGTILFAQDYTRSLAPNAVNITSVDGQQIQFYSDVSCITTAGVALALPLASTNLTLSPGDGVKNVYAKIINGTQFSSCLTDSIILDQTSPSLAITAPSLNTNIAGNSLTISGSCSELNAPTVSVGITLNGVAQNINCASGLFTSNFNITTVPVGSQNISLSATDLAGNIGTANSSFNRINCNEFQTLAGNSCTDNDPIGTIAFVTDYTNILSPNSVTITSSNSMQLQFYSDSGCITTVGTAISLPAASTNLTVSSGDGTKTAYAKFINGSQSSACLSDTIILDTVANYSLISSGIVDRTVSSNLNFSGVCETTSGDTLTVSILGASDVQIGSSTAVTCSGDSYSSSIIVPANAEKLRIQAVDKAGNTFSSTVDILTYGSLSFDSSSINADADSGFTKNSSVSLNLSSTENAKEMIVSSSNTCATSYESFQTPSSRSLTANASNSFYVKLKNRTTISSCLLVGTIVHDSIAPTVGAVNFVLKEYGESNSTPNLSLGASSDTNLKNLQYSISSDNVNDNVRVWTDISSLITTHIGTGTMSDKLFYHYRLRAKDKAGNLSTVSSRQFKHYNLYPYIALKDDGSGNKILDNGSSRTYFLYDFAKRASASAVKEDFSGVHVLKHNNTIVTTELLSFDAGTYGATSYCNSTTDIMCMVRFNGNTILNGTHIPQVRKRGMVIYVDGNLTINSGAIVSMTARGASAAGQQVFIHPLASIGAAGGNGGAAYSNVSAPTATTTAPSGSSGINGAAGGGASGGAGRNSTWSAVSGAGSAGTSWSGGSGGGNAGTRNGGCTAGAAGANGGAGGNACATGVALNDWGAGGGAGNNGGNGANGGSAGGTGTGGTLIIYVKGNFINNGSLQANGVTSFTGGGGSGGGVVTVIYGGSLSGSGTTSVAGGAMSEGFGGGRSGTAGAGTSRIIQANIDDYMFKSCAEIRTAYPTAMNGTYLIDSDGIGSTLPVEVTCDMTGGGWTKIIGDSSESAASIQTYIQSIANTSALPVTATYDVNSTYGFQIRGSRNNDTYECINFDKFNSINEIKFTYSSFFNSPAACYNVSYVAINGFVMIGFLDAWSNTIDGQVLTQNNIQGGKIQANYDQVNYTRTFASPQSGLQLCYYRYAAQTNPATQCIQAFKNMSFK